MFRKKDEMEMKAFDGCHNGKGKLDCRNVLKDIDCKSEVMFMHDDLLEPGATIGYHPHEGSEEIYFVVDGAGTMTLDDVDYPIGPGDVCVCSPGQSHGIKNADDKSMRLVVVGVRTP